jgi:putative ABC transport system ATP-binding protein
MLKLNNICVRNTLVNLNLSVSKGEFVLIAGANGTGKTTLFKVISGEIAPSSGSAFIDGTDVTGVSKHKRSKYISSVLQNPKAGTIGEMTILENINLAYMRGNKNKVSKRNIDYFKEKLSMLNMNLESRLDEYVNNLSGGQRQALSLIMAIVANYELLLLDEITAALDPVTSDMVMELVNKIVLHEKKTCLLITHNARYINAFGDRTLNMNNGKLDFLPN